MPHHEKIALRGVIENVFAHRFTVLSKGQTHLADLGPKGAEAFPLVEGLTVTLEGERRPSEIKVLRISKKGGHPVDIEHKKPHHGPKHHHPDVAADPELILKAVGKAGWTVEGEPERKPKHFEVLAYQGEGDWTELHVDFAGVIYKEKPADAHKWGIEA
ncbi:hypothetical protein SAMN05428989_1962 [Pseudoxanthomonas sp. GM95]|uniref:hypothetical protein n=1 Tax=Pseudoxanthomonas sp. GM95 TaxID=1881043 RepID=UPI0008D394AD|nr:hypothetical protein [Pseudoxanthomonas sp. GM95]SEL57476.1 hypothetical protein SAMN05428989_1962 [Pseudoxanthomonas sp. GM95]